MRPPRNLIPAAAVAAVFVIGSLAAAHPHLSRIVYTGRGRMAIERDGRDYPLGMFLRGGLLEAFPEETGRAHLQARQARRSLNIAQGAGYGGLAMLIAGLSIANGSPEAGGILTGLGLGASLAGLHFSFRFEEELFRTTEIYNEERAKSEPEPAAESQDEKPGPTLTRSEPDIGRIRWNADSISALVVGTTTKQAALLRVGVPHERMSVGGLDERWIYRPESRITQLRRTAFLDFAGDVLADARLMPDIVEERKGFVMDFSYGGGVKLGRGRESYTGVNSNTSLDFGWAPHERAAILWDFMSSRRPGGTTSIFGLGLRFFPVVPWYVQGSIGSANDKFSFSETGPACSSYGNQSVDGPAFLFKTGREFGFKRTWAWAPEFFAGYSRMTGTLQSPCRLAGNASVVQRATFLGLAARIAWYP